MSVPLTYTPKGPKSCILLCNRWTKKINFFRPLTALSSAAFRPASRRPHPASPDTAAACRSAVRTGAGSCSCTRSAAGRLNLHPIRERTSCGSRLNALAQIACLWLRSFLQIEVFVSLVQAGRLSLHPIRISVGCMATPSTSQDPVPATSNIANPTKKGDAGLRHLFFRSSYCCAGPCSSSVWD